MARLSHHAGVEETLAKAVSVRSLLGETPGVMAAVIRAKGLS